jgi:hypothetical protein
MRWVCTDKKKKIEPQRHRGAEKKEFLRKRFIATEGTEEENE